MRITIGLPFYNSGDLLLDCVRSIFAQAEQDWELLLIDDGSTDNSLTLARSIDDPRVHVISDGRNIGLPARLNQIAELAEGEFIARQDADDLMHPQRLAEQMACLDKEPRLDAVGCPWIAINEHSEVVGYSRARSLDLRRRNVLRRVPLSHCTVLGRREFFRRIPYANELRRSQDRDFWIRAILFEKSEIELLDEPRYFYRIPRFIPISKTLAGYRNDRFLLRKYGWSQLGIGRTAAYILESLSKSALWRLAASAGISSPLSNARWAPLDKCKRQLAQQVVRQIHAHPVPRVAQSIQARVA